VLSNARILDRARTYCCLGLACLTHCASTNNRFRHEDLSSICPSLEEIGARKKATCRSVPRIPATAQVWRFHYRRLITHGVRGSKYTKVINTRPYGGPDRYMEWAKDVANVLQHAFHVCQLDILENRAPRPDGLCLLQKLTWLKPLRTTGSIASAQSSHDFGNLRHLRIHTDLIRENGIQFIFSIPSLRVLHLSHIVQNIPFADWAVPESSFNIKELNSGFCSMNTAVIAQILSCVKALESFLFDNELLGTLSMSSIDRESYWSILGDALRTHKRSLR
jgi:hypothetical protein